MATLVSGFLDTTLPIPAASAPMRWTTWAGSYANEGSGTHIGERVWTASPSWRTFAASRYAIGGMEVRLTSPIADRPIFACKAGANEAASLRYNSAGSLILYVNGASIATNLAALSFGTFYTLEFAVDNGSTFSSAMSIETRRDGTRIPELTTTNFTAAGGQPAGTLAPPNSGPSGTGGPVIDRIELGHAAQLIFIYWYYQKNGSSLWTTVTTGTTWALLSEFEGSKKRAWLQPTVVGNYTMAGAGSGTLNSNWSNGVGTYPTSIADAGGMDSDSSYIKNQIAGILGALIPQDKISHKYTLLPDAATTIGFVQRTIVARKESAGTDVIQSGLRSPAAASVPNTDFMDTAETLGGTYTIPAVGGVTYYAQAPFTVGGTTVWAPGTIGTTTVTADRIEGIDAQATLT